MLLSSFSQRGMNSLNFQLSFRKRSDHLLRAGRLVFFSYRGCRIYLTSVTNFAGTHGQLFGRHLRQPVQAGSVFGYQVQFPRLCIIYVVRVSRRKIERCAYQVDPVQLDHQSLS